MGLFYIMYSGLQHLILHFPTYHTGREKKTTKRTRGRNAKVNQISLPIIHYDTRMSAAMKNAKKKMKDLRARKSQR